LRVALGARAQQVGGMVVRQSLVLVGVGIAIGLGGALATTRVLRSLLFEVDPTDPATLLAVSLVLVGVALAASLLPARRATRIDPMEALRHE